MRGIWPGTGTSFIGSQVKPIHMRSRAHIKTHPLHPILVTFPLTLFTGTLVFDILAIARDKESFENTAYYLLIGGVAMALIAAIPGFLDFLHTVPPKSSAKKRASTHAILNLCMVALFGASLVYRTNNEQASGLLILILEGAGFVLMNIAGWMGGTLVHRNQIGIDHRYAFAGKWREEELKSGSGRIKLGNLHDLKRDQMMLTHVSDKRVVIARTEDGYVAFEDRCTHKGGSLADGVMMCGTVQCPWHGSQFDVRNGSVKAGPAGEKISTYKVENVNGTLYLVLN